MSDTSSKDRLNAFLNSGKAGSPAATAAPTPTKSAPAPQSADEADAPAIGSEGIHIPSTDLSDFWTEGWHLIEIVGLKHGISKGSGKPMVIATYRGVAGDMGGCYKTDYWNLLGAGAKKTGRIAKVLGFRCPDTGDVKLPKLELAIGLKMWIKIVHKEELYDRGDGSEPTKQLKDEIEFPNGYAEEGAFELPKAGDLFAEAGAPLATG